MSSTNHNLGNGVERPIKSLAPVQNGYQRRQPLPQMTTQGPARHRRSPSRKRGACRTPDPGTASHPRATSCPEASTERSPRNEPPSVNRHQPTCNGSSNTGSHRHRSTSAYQSIFEKQLAKDDAAKLKVICHVVVTELRIGVQEALRCGCPESNLFQRHDHHNHNRATLPSPPERSLRTSVLNACLPSSSKNSFDSPPLSIPAS